jgi:hypothetical protein
MATRSRTSFQKRQKEILRMEKQREKASKRVERKLALGEPLDGPELLPEFLDYDEDSTARSASD